MSNDDFGGMLRELFDRSTMARFEWARWATLRGRLTLVFTYRVAMTHSHRSIGYQHGPKDPVWSIITGYSGEVFIDNDTHQVTRIVEQADAIPPDFPIRRAQMRLDYDYSDIGGHPYLLPYRGEMQLEMSDVLTKNLNDFLHYKKYSADSAITYDIPKDIPAIPDSKLEETPATKSQLDCKDPKNKDLSECKSGTGKN